MYDWLIHCDQSCLILHTGAKGTGIAKQYQKYFINVGIGHQQLMTMYIQLLCN